MAVASIGPATTGRLQASAVIWLSSSFCAPAADDVDHADFPAQHIFQPFQRPAIGQGQAVEAGADEFAAGVGRPLAGLPAELLDLQRASRRATGTACDPDRSARRSGLLRAGHLRQLGVAVVVSFAPEMPPAFLHQPQAHDVLQEPDRPADAAFVGVVVFQRFVIDDGLGKLHAHQRPGAGADVAPVVALGRHGRHGAGGVVAGRVRSPGSRRRRTPAPRPSRSGPMIVPDGTISGRICVGSPSFSSMPVAQAFFRGSYIWLVLAIENSLLRTPVNR